MAATLLAEQVGVLPAVAFSEMKPSPMMVMFPHSFALSRHVPVRGSPPVHVAVSAFEVKMIGLFLSPWAKSLAPLVMARLPPMPVSLAMTVPG